MAKASQLFLMTREWALATDDHQWILQKRVGGVWQDQRFVRSKAGIVRCMERDGVRPFKSAQRALDALPETWRDWVSSVGAHYRPPARPRLLH
jgi:hypothetical protein